METVPAADPRWGPVASDLAEFIAVIVHGFAPEKLLIGGGVGLGVPHLLPRALTEVPGILGGYYPDLDAAALAAIVTAPALGADAGPLGAIALALAAAGPSADPG